MTAVGKAGTFCAERVRSPRSSGGYMAGGDRASGFRAALRHRDYRLLMGRYAVSAIGSWAYNVALVFFVFDQTHSAGWVAAASLGRMVPALVLSPYAGIVAERFERRRVMLTSDIVAFLLMLALAAVVAVEGPVVLAIVLAAMTTITTLVDEPSSAAMIPQLVGEDDLAAANGLSSLLENATVLIGPALGAGLLLVASPSMVFVINSLSFAAGALLMARVHARSQATDVTEGGEAGVFKQLAVGFKAIGSSTTAAVLVGFSVLASFVYGTDTVLFALVGEKIGIGADGYGYLLAGLGVGGVLAAGLVNRLAALPRLGVVITIGMGVYCLPTALLAFTDSAPVAIGLQVVRGAGTLVVDVLAVTALQRTLPQHLIARVFGVFWSLIIGAIALGAALMPLAINAFGVDGALLTVGVGVPVLVLLTTPWLVRMDRGAVARLAELAPRVRLLEVLNIFSGASRPALERLASGATEVSAAPGDVIVREGAPADALYVLTTGEVAVSARGEAGSSRRLRTMNAPSYFGEVGLLQRIPRTATVKALEPVTMYRIDGDDFLAALSATPAAPAFLESAKARLGRTHPSLADEFTAAGPPADQPEPERTQ